MDFFICSQKEEDQIIPTKLEMSLNKPMLWVSREIIIKPLTILQYIIILLRVCIIICSTRPVPGYGGFVPRYPQLSLEHHGNSEVSSSMHMCSTTRETFRLGLELIFPVRIHWCKQLIYMCRGFPKQENTDRTFCHKGPLSKTVTLTYPFNPFNKVVWMYNYQHEV